MKLSIVIAMYNEAKRFPKQYPNVRDFLKKYSKEKGFEYEVIAINDGSYDDTLKMLSEYKDEITILSHPKNTGKGFSLRQGVEFATGDWIYLCDADFSTPIEELDNFLKYKDDFDLVMGSRARADSKVNVSGFRKFLGEFGNWMIRKTLGFDYKDTQCGFKLFKKDVKQYFLRCRSKRWGFDFEFLYLLTKYNRTVKEIPVKWDQSEGSRVKPHDYIKTLIDLIKVRIYHG